MKLRKDRQTWVARWISRIAIAFVMAGAPVTANADTILATNATGVPLYYLSENGTAGYQFRVGDSAFDVTMLGFYDYEENGFANSHRLGIFALDGALLASTEVGSGTGAPLEAGFRWADLGSTYRLSANTSYVIASTMVANDWSDLMRPLATIDPLFSVTNGALYDHGSGLFKPTTSGGDQGYFGPNLRGIAVPDGGSMFGLLGLGAIGIAALRVKFAK